jgi:hypothetical protein
LYIACWPVPALRQAAAAPAAPVVPGSAST